jgi:hypothetical protein
MRSGCWFSALFIIFILTAPVSGAEIQRIVVKGDDNTSDVRLTITDGPLLGITETLPAGSNITSCSLPFEQYRISAGSLHLAVIGESEVAYTLRGGETDPISGTWTDFSDGSKGTILGEGQSLPPPTHSATPTIPATTKAAGAGMIPAFSALCLIGATVLYRRHGP